MQARRTPTLKSAADGKAGGRCTEIEGGVAMNRGIYALPVITILGLLAGCVSGPPLQTTIIVSPSKPLEIYGVRTYRTNKGVLVMGRVRRQMIFRGPVWGHLHRSEEQTTELQSLMRNSYAVFS